MQQGNIDLVMPDTHILQYCIYIMYSTIQKRDVDPR